MKILLIGKNGQLGTELEKILVTHGVEVRAYGHHDLDITNYPKVKQILTRDLPDIVINTSAQNVLIDCEKYPQKALEINALALKNLAENCRGLKIKLVTYSTDYVFDGAKGKPYTETDPPNPLQMYGLSKLAGEIICLNYNPQSIVIRTCGLYGGTKGSRAKKGNIVLNLIKACEGKSELEVSSEQIVSPTYALDLAYATWKLLKLNPPRGVYHLVNEGHCSWSEFAAELARLRRLDTHIVPINRHGQYAGIHRPAFSALENVKAKKMGLALPTWKDALKRYTTHIL